MLYAQVVLPLAQPMYTFSVDERLGVGVGDAVVVQFGSSRFYTGIVWSITDQRPDYPRIKPILKRQYSTPLVGAETQRLWEWIAEYYMTTVGEVMRMALPSLAKPSATTYAEIDEHALDVPQESYIALSEELRSEEGLAEYVERHSRRAPRRTELLDIIATTAEERGYEDGFVPRRLLDIPSEQLLALRKKGLILTQERDIQSGGSGGGFLCPTLSEAQNEALNTILKAHGESKVALLHGVTGSGKTEIYIYTLLLRRYHVAIAY